MQRGRHPLSDQYLVVIPIKIKTVRNLLKEFKYSFDSQTVNLNRPSVPVTASDGMKFLGSQG